MNPSRLRAFRFVHPDFDFAQAAHGLVTSPTGGLAMAEDDAAVRQALLILLSTTPGERVMRPDYGCDLHRLLFSANDATTAGLAVHYVRQAVERFEPRVEIETLTAGPGGESAADRLRIDLTYRVRATRNTDRVALELGLSGR